MVILSLRLNGQVIIRFINKYTDPETVSFRQLKIDKKTKYMFMYFKIALKTN